jgi:hypothetical protein
MMALMELLLHQPRRTLPTILRSLLGIVYLVQNHLHRFRALNMRVLLAKL